MDSITILGCRGSVPRAGTAFSKYGGNTSCVLVSLAGETLFLDAGTGLMEPDYPSAGTGKKVSLLLSHTHADHLLGLPLCPLLMDPAGALDIYLRSRGGLSPAAQLERYVSPPLWPVRLEQLPARVTVRELPTAPFSIGNVRIESMEGVHPGGVTLLRLSGNGHSVVYASDCTLTPAILPALVKFAKDCDLLLCDGQYSQEEYWARPNFGHSSWNMAGELGERCGAKQTRIIHHDPYHTDAFLDAAAPTLEALYPGAAFALDKEEIRL